jgi:hypothetical protein
MSVPGNVAGILRQQVVLEVESIDRMYLNVYVPQLQRALGVVSFFRYHRQTPVPSSALMGPMTRAFVESIQSFVQQHRIPLVEFAKGQRKDDIAQQRLAAFKPDEGVVFVGKAQEKASVFRTEKRRNAQTGQAYPWIVRSTAMVNAYYFYCLDRDFGPFFLKFCSYFPYNAKLCLNGHEYLKRQLQQRGIIYQALDNGILSCEQPKRLQAMADQLSAAKIDALLRKWLARLPHPFTPADRRADYRYDLSILQAEFSLTQVLDRPLTGRVFFEPVIRENLDLGRPDQVQLIFNRRVTRRTPGRFRTRVITNGVIPSLHVDYQHSRIKQYHKEGRALRTETTINDTRDFGIGKRLKNLPALRQIGFAANRRLLDVQQVSHDCTVGEDVFRQTVRPIDVGGQRASGLRFDDARVQALLSVLIVLCLRPRGFAQKEMRALLAPSLGLDPATLTPGRMTYDLRRLRLHGLIRRLPQTHRYEATGQGLRIALFLSRTYARILRPGLAQIASPQPPQDSALRQAFDDLDRQIREYCDAAKIAA